MKTTFLCILMFFTTSVFGQWYSTRFIHDDYMDFTNPHEITFSDMNNDGYIDFMFSCSRISPAFIADIKKNIHDGETNPYLGPDFTESDFARTFSANVNWNSISFRNDNVDDLISCYPAGGCLWEGTSDNTVDWSWTDNISDYNVESAWGFYNNDDYKDIIFGGDGILKFFNGDDIDPYSSSPDETFNYSGDLYELLTIDLIPQPIDPDVDNEWIFLATSSYLYKIRYDNGTGLFYSYGVSMNCIDIAIDDVTGDGYPDVVASTGSQILLFSNNGQGSVDLTSDWSGSISSRHIELTDGDMDGKADLVVLYYDDANSKIRIRYYESTGSGFNTSYDWQSPEYSNVDAATDLVLADVHNKGGESIFAALSVFNGAVVNAWHYLGDPVPTAPKKLHISNSSGNPTLKWIKNWQRDIDEYRIFRKITTNSRNPQTIENWTLIGTTNNTSYTDTEFGIMENGSYIAYYKIKAKDDNAQTSGYSNTVSTEGVMQMKPVTGTERIPEIFALHNNYPNPFNPVTTIKFDLPEEKYVTLSVYDIKGSLIKTLVNNQLTAGQYEVKFNAESLPSGIYIYKFNAGNFSAIKRMVVLK